MWLHKEYHRYSKSLASNSNSEENNFVWIFPSIDLWREYRKGAHGTRGSSKVLVETVESWTSIARVARTGNEIYGSSQDFTRSVPRNCFMPFSYHSYMNGRPPLLIASCVSQQIYIRLRLALFEHIIVT